MAFFVRIFRVYVGKSKENPRQTKAKDWFWLIPEPKPALPMVKSEPEPKDITKSEPETNP